MDPERKIKNRGVYTVTETAYKKDKPGSPGSKAIYFYNTPFTIETIELESSIQVRDPKYTNNSKQTLLVKIDQKDVSMAWQVEYEIKNSKGSVKNGEVIQLSHTTHIQLSHTTHIVTPETN
ncbi:hypothetical protein [Candidatus Williamhamiltonella defendens]|uniref:hypothetical protein n=1 Tax=Candidatus Williamhamiltonella defendens TaxID=138072 RepID=UPI00130E3F0B|nr:hypothetical protein [Candidatus Hamiltonella defensa]